MSSVKKLFNRLGKKKKSRTGNDFLQNVTEEDPTASTDQQHRVQNDVDALKSTVTDQNMDDEYCKPFDLKNSANVYDLPIDNQPSEQEIGNIYDDVFDAKSTQDQSTDDDETQAILRNRSKFNSSQKRLSRPHLPSQDSRAAEDYDDPWQSIADHSIKLAEKMRHSVSESQFKPTDETARTQQRLYSADDKNLSDAEIKPSLKSYNHEKLTEISSDSLNQNDNQFNPSTSQLPSIPKSQHDTENGDYQDPWAKNEVNNDDLQNTNNSPTDYSSERQLEQGSKPEVPPRLPDEVLQSVLLDNSDGNNEYAEPCDEIISDIKSSLENNSWFHGSLSRNQTEAIMKDVDVGSYLVRNSESSKFQQVYSLSVRTQTNGVVHIKIDPVPDGFILGKNGKVFPSIASMIGHYQDNPLRIKGAERQSLLHPIIKNS